jgi:mRNA interferase MazF
MLEYILQVLDWCKTKASLWNRQSNVVFKEGELWWCSIGMNVGHEIYGKGPLFSRPVLIFKKSSPNLFLGIPLTSKLKPGIWEVSIIHNGKTGAAILDQARAFDRKRLIKRIGSVGSQQFKLINVAFWEFYGADRSEKIISAQSNNIPETYTPPEGGASG